MLLMLSSSTFVVYIAGCTLGNKFPFTFIKIIEKLHVIEVVLQPKMRFL